MFGVGHPHVKQVFLKSWLPGRSEVAAFFARGILKSLFHADCAESKCRSLPQSIRLSSASCICFMCKVLVRAVGVEPTLCQPELDFESSASTSSATPACSREFFALQLPRDSFAALNRVYLPQHRASSPAKPPADSQGKTLHRWARNSALKVLLTHGFRRWRGSNRVFGCWGDHDGGWDIRRRQPPDRVEPPFRAAREGFHFAGEHGIKRCHRQSHFDQAFLGHWGEEIEIAQDKRGFGDDCNRMIGSGQHFEHLAHEKLVARLA
jgi:hypothetical protein